MKTISQAVWSIISTDSVLLELLSKGYLNSSAYAKDIKPQLESELLVTVSMSSIITALSRIKRSAIESNFKIPRFEINDLSFKLPISELVFQKLHNPSHALSEIYKEIENENDVHFNVITVENELDIFISSSKVGIATKHLKKFNLVHSEANLSALILKYDAEYRKYPGMGSQILNALAVNSITMIECLTTYREFIIYIKQEEANRAIDLLSREFM